jgi:hypothetical protein
MQPYPILSGMSRPRIAALCLAASRYGKQPLAAIVPLPRAHLVRYAGCLAPHSKLRAAIIPTPRQRGPIGDVRAAAVYFAPSWLEIPFEIGPPSASSNRWSRGRRPSKPLKRHPNPS